MDSDPNVQLTYSCSHVRAGASVDCLSFWLMRWQCWESQPGRGPGARSLLERLQAGLPGGPRSQKPWLPCTTIAKRNVHCSVQQLIARHPIQRQLPQDVMHPWCPVGIPKYMKEWMNNKWRTCLARLLLKRTGHSTESKHLKGTNSSQFFMLFIQKSPSSCRALTMER